MNDSGAIKGLDAREDGVYITYSTGADTVTKKLGETKKLKSFVLTGTAKGGSGQMVGNSVRVYCNYDSDGNFMGFSPTSTSWNSNVGQGYGEGNCSVSSPVIE